MAQNDRTTGLVGNAGFKVPCRAATTAAIVLAGEQTIDGVACVTDDRVLVKDQADAADNGIWVVDTGNWSRAKDFDGAYDIVDGSLVRVNEGSTNATGIFSIESTDEDIVIGTTEFTFSRTTINFTIHEAQTAIAGQTVFNLGSAYQVGANGVAVYLNGLRVRVDTDFNETTSSRITFLFPLQAGDQVDFYTGQAIGNLTAALAALVAITDAGDFYLSTSVEAAFQEIVEALAEDNGDADATFNNAVSARVQRWDTTLTQNRTLTLSAVNAKEGATCMAVRGSGATGNFTLSVGGLATLRAPGEWAITKYDAGVGAWVLIAYGTLPSAEILAMSADKGDASANLTVGTTERTVRWGTTLTADRTADLQAAGAYTGARFLIERLETSGGNFALAVRTGTSVLARLSPAQWAIVEHTGSAWILVALGNLRQFNSNLCQLHDDFDGEEINGYRWQSLVGTDAECRQAIVLADQVGGVIRLTTGDDAAATMAVNGVQLHSQLNWKPNKGGLFCEVRVALSSIASVAVFVGLTDQRALIEMPFTLGAGDALTSNATDACGVLFDTAADTDNWWAVGVAADIDAAKQNLAVAPVAATFETWRIELDSAGVASFYRNNVFIGATMAGAVTPAALLTPVVACFSRTNASRNIDVDLIALQQQR